MRVILVIIAVVGVGLTACSKSGGEATSVAAPTTGQNAPETSRLPSSPIVGDWQQSGASKSLKFDCVAPCTQKAFSWRHVGRLSVDEQMRAVITGSTGRCDAVAQVVGDEIIFDDLQCDAGYIVDSADGRPHKIEFSGTHCFAVTYDDVQFFYAQPGVDCDGSPTPPGSTTTLTSVGNAIK